MLIISSFIAPFDQLVGSDYLLLLSSLSLFLVAQRLLLHSLIFVCSSSLALFSVSTHFIRKHCFRFFLCTIHFTVVDSSIQSLCVCVSMTLLCVYLPKWRELDSFPQFVTDLLSYVNSDFDKKKYMGDQSRWSNKKLSATQSTQESPVHADTRLVFFSTIIVKWQNGFLLLYFVVVIVVVVVVSWVKRFYFEPAQQAHRIAMWIERNLAKRLRMCTAPKWAESWSLPFSGKLQLSF